jgi:adenylate cyclase
VNSINPNFRNNLAFVLVFLISVGITLTLRQTGVLQLLEWATLDGWFQLRPRVPPDPRIIIVGITEADISQAERYPFSDQLLAQLINQIKDQQPRVIGLDLYRNLPVPPGEEELLEIFQSTPNLIGVEKSLGNQSYEQVPPPPVLAQLNQVAAADLLLDLDGVVRRAMLFPTQNHQNLGLAVALIYLQGEGIEPSTAADGKSLALGDTTFSPLEPNAGGYRRANPYGYQMLINYRGSTGYFSHVSVFDVLDGKIDPNLFRDRVVLIGSRADSLNEGFPTPYSGGLGSAVQLMHGVEIHANIASQVLSAVLDERELFRFLPEPLELVWIIFGSGAITLLGWVGRSTLNPGHLSLKILGATTLSGIMIVVGSYGAFLAGWWIPVASPLLALVSAAVAIGVTLQIFRLKDQARLLEMRVQERTTELEQKNAQLQATQKQLVAQEKLATLGMVTAGLYHGLKNPFNLINVFSDWSIQLTEELEAEVEPLLFWEQVLEQNLTIEQKINDLTTNLQDIKQQVQRADQLLQNLPLPSQEERLEASPIDINQLLETSVQLSYYGFQKQYGSFPLNLETDYDASILSIDVVIPEMSHALLNLLDNAFFAVYLKEQSNVSFSPAIWVKTKKLSEFLEITIRDNGIGIPEEIKKQIFHPFFTTKPPEAGTGLGLAITRDVIEKHGGTIEVESEERRFTQFKITLPSD